MKESYILASGYHMKQRWRRPRKPPQNAALLVLPALIVGGAIGYVASEPQLTHSIWDTLKGQRPTCDIKGNINDRGEKIYHLPGDAYYSETVVDQNRGERWFCSTWDAWSSGWRRARI